MNYTGITFFKFKTESGKVILIDACYTLAQATEKAKRQDVTATYECLEIKW